MVMNRASAGLETSLISSSFYTVTAKLDELMKHALEVLKGLLSECLLVLELEAITAMVTAAATL